MLASWWARLVTLAKTDPAAVMAAIQAALALAVTLGLTLTPGETGAIEGGTTAVLGLIVAIYTRPFRTGAITALAAAAGTILLAFKVPGITPGAVSAANVFITSLLMLAVTSPQTMSLMLLHRAQPPAEHAAPKRM